MKKANSRTASQRLAGTVQMARLRVATAENRWKAAKAQARAAKRRRKEVKLIARRARKQAKQAKADLTEARKALAKVEAKLAQSGARLAARKPARAKASKGAKPIVAAPREKAAPAREDPPTPTAPSPVIGSGLGVPPDSTPAKPSDL